MVRFVATADWQLGMAARFLQPEAQARYGQARLDAVRRIGEVAAERDAAFVVVGGDVFESNQLDRRVVVRAFEALADVEVPVYLLPGNHDPLDASSLYTSGLFARHRPDHVHVLDAPGVHRVADGVEIVAAPWFGKRPLGDLVAQALAPLEPAPDGVVRVLVGHGQVDVLDPDSSRPTSVVLDDLTAALDDGRVHVAVLGDRHSTTQVEPRVWYPGTPEVTARRETDPGNVLLVDVGPSHLEVETVRVGRWVFEAPEHRLDSTLDVAALLTELGARRGKERTATWLRLSGTLALRDKIALDAGLDDLAHAYARLDLWHRHTDLAVVPDDHDFADLALTGFAAEAVDELRDQAAATGDDARAAQDALGLLHRLVGAAR
ncbi:metallophosphoesterase family protein [Solicola sp. PLA-1-18]|uniref:metallophosphoesterase family protein n=1 Tax=Solicola sp. PLA-1-18 TaxID=3380532 RepID=UPI003B82A1E5